MIPGTGECTQELHDFIRRGVSVTIGVHNTQEFVSDLRIIMKFRVQIIYSKLTALMDCQLYGYSEPVYISKYIIIILT